jgi:hypothetical protein
LQSNFVWTIAEGIGAVSGVAEGERDEPSIVIGDEVSCFVDLLVVFSVWDDDNCWFFFVARISLEMNLGFSQRKLHVHALSEVRNLLGDIFCNELIAVVHRLSTVSSVHEAVGEDRNRVLIVGRSLGVNIGNQGGNGLLD